MSSAFTIDDVSKHFRWHADKRTSIKERFMRGKPQMQSEFWALKNISFEVKRGSTFGLIGHNGSGKSTMLKLLAGIHRPSSGTITTNGRISALLELGAGFHPELTGRENIYLNASILGLSKKQTEQAIDGIVDFSGIDDFIDVPVKVYSSGMYVRLGFSIAVAVKPEILIVDEIIAVGDEEFQRKCFDHIHDLRHKGTTIVMVSHALSLVEGMCDEVVWLDHGEMQHCGNARTVVREYLDAVNLVEISGAGSAEESDVQLPTDALQRRGSGEIIVTSVEVLDEDGQPVKAALSLEPYTVRMHYRASEPVSEPVFGLGFRNETGINVAGPNSSVPGALGMELNGVGYVDFEISQLILQPGTFDIDAAIVHKGHVYDYVERISTMKVRGKGDQGAGLVYLGGNWRSQHQVH